MEELLAAREREFRSLAENLPDIVMRFDRDGRRTYINSAYQRFTGKTTAGRSRPKKIKKRSRLVGGY